MLRCKPVDTPMDSTITLRIKDDSTPIDNGQYQRFVGKLIYLSHTRQILVFQLVWLVNS